MDQPKLERLLRVMMYLSNNRSLTIDDIARKLETSQRTVYRYVDTFREAGFVVKDSGGSIYRLDRTNRFFKDISELVHFNDEEAYILKSAIESISDNNLLKQNLKKKLYSVYDYKILADTVVNTKNGKNVSALKDAMNDRKQVRLKEYRSSHKGDISDRIVEPFKFTTNFISVWCFEPSSGQNKLFSISRIGSVELLPEDWQNEDKHEEGITDIFRFSSHQTYHIKVAMTLRATNLMIEEYPLSEKYITRNGQKEWILECDVCSFFGITRFIRGLPHDIEVLESQELKKFLADKNN